MTGEIQKPQNSAIYIYSKKYLMSLFANSANSFGTSRALMASIHP